MAHRPTGLHGATLHLTVFDQNPLGPRTNRARSMRRASLHAALKAQYGLVNLYLGATP